MKNGIFNQIAIPRVRKSKFDLSHEKKLSFQMGELIPIMCQEIVPGDSFRVQSQLFLRLQALLSPVMHRCDVTTHYFFVPNRLIWTEWEDFITGGRVGTTLPVAPQLTINNTTKINTAIGTLADYLGVPDLSTQVYSNDVNISALPFRAYQRIYNDYYRDNVITQPVNFTTNSGIGTSDWPELNTIRKRAWQKDYFSTARPNSQLGAEVIVPSNTTVTYKPQSDVKRVDGVDANAASTIGTLAAGKLGVNNNSTSGRIENIDVVSTQMSINNLRRSLKLQEWLEKNMRAGSRYVEQILSHFGVRSSDQRLDRAEYLGGGKQPITISEVLQTAQGTNPVGTMNGHGYSVGNSNQFQKTFEEHGFVMAIVSVLPQTAYQQGLNRMFSRTDKFDYYWPEFANIGEQEVKNKEIYAQINSVNEGTFGYQQRYAEYKYCPDTVHGEFKTSLAFWHMSRIFSNLPTLNTSFIDADPTQRIYAITDPAVDKLLLQVYHKIDALRPMPYFSIPSI